MTNVLWLQHGDSDLYEVTIPQECKSISNLITLIRKDFDVKTQLLIPENCGPITLLQHNREELDTTLKLNQVFQNGIGTDKEPIIIQIAQQAFKKQKLNPVPEWKPESPFDYSIEEGTKFFVNREQALKQLHVIHKAKYYRASASGVGENWIIPIADNVIGLGKSEFGRHYIYKSKELWKDVENKTAFQKILCDCHTIYITFRTGALSGEVSFDTVTMNYLTDALKLMFQSEPDIIINPPPGVDNFLIKFTQMFGPVFIVLDEIGAAFEDSNLNDIQRREKFLSFCTNIVGKWLFLEKVFFLLLGRGSFLSYINNGYADLKLTSSNFKFERLN